MADETLGFTVKVDGIEKQITNLKELKLATKQAKDEQVKAALAYGESSEQYIKASKAVSALKDKVDDLGDSTKSLKGSGIERSTQGFSQLGEGLRNLDFDKVKVGLTAVKSALAATGVMLIVQGVMYLIENFDKLSKGSGIVAKALRVVGDVIQGAIDLIYKLTDAIGLTNSALDKMGEAVVENAEKSKAALDEQTASYDRQMKVAAAAGKSTIDIEKKKQDAIIQTNKAIIDQIVAFVRAGGELDDEQKKILTASIANIKNAVADKKAIELKDESETKKKGEEAYKKRQEDREKKKKEDEADFNNALAQQEKEEAERTRLNEIDKKKAKEAAKEREDLKKVHDKEDEDSRALAVDNLLKESERRKQIAESEEKAKTDIRQASFDTAKGLEELIGQIALNRARGNAAEELKIKKAMFAVDKAFNVARAVQDGIRSVQAALTIPPPFGQVLAGINAGLAAVNIGKILATKFDGGGGSGSADVGISSGGTPNIGGGLNTSAPIIPQQQTQQSTSYNSQGQKIEAYVVETKQRDATNLINKYNKQSEY